MGEYVEVVEFFTETKFVSPQPERRCDSLEGLQLVIYVLL